jgi:hypothetical protein
MPSCKFGCGKEAAPGPLVMHERSCAKNPDRSSSITQPRGTCAYCGKESTAGAIKTHELYGCKNRPESMLELGRVPCKNCDKLFLPGPLVVHERACAGV